MYNESAVPLKDVVCCELTINAEVWHFCMNLVMADGTGCC